LTFQICKIINTINVKTLRLGEIKCVGKEEYSILYINENKF